MEKEFVRLINKHVGILQKICNIYFYGNPYKEDYYQEILIRLWKAYPGFNQQSTFSTWLYRVALNTSIDIIRKQTLQPVQVELSQKEYCASDFNQDSESEQRDQLYRAIDCLSEIDKAIIILYLEGYEYKEIATIMGISENYAGVKINRIKGELHKRLSNGKR